MPCCLAIVRSHLLTVLTVVRLCSIKTCFRFLLTEPETQKGATYNMILCNKHDVLQHFTLLRLCIQRRKSRLFCLGRYMYLLSASSVEQSSWEANNLPRQSRLL
jgi:hypothetical protein